MIDVARLRSAPQRLALSPELVRPEYKVKVGCGQLRRLSESVAERAVVIMALMPCIIATEIRRGDAEDHLMDGPGIAGRVGSHEGRRNNACHREAKAKRQSENDRGPDRHAKDMPKTLAKVNGVDLRDRACANQ